MTVKTLVEMLSQLDPDEHFSMELISHKNLIEISAGRRVIFVNKNAQSRSVELMMGVANEPWNRGDYRHLKNQEQQT